MEEEKYITVKIFIEGVLVDTSNEPYKTYKEFMEFIEKKEKSYKILSRHNMTTNQVWIYIWRI